VLSRSARFGAIHYAKPFEYLAWPDSLGDAKATREQGARLKGESDPEMICKVLN
jgi:hypothetical protein